MKKNVLLLLLLVMFQLTNAQNVGVGTAVIDPSAKLQVESTTSGLLPPRMTTAQRNAIPSPA
ncbi:MAG: hypothetical protein KAY96_05980, partial [Bacteroidia bacterium]|nr:hypothetical protein [Bacteroidia bacterium]